MAEKQTIFRNKKAWFDYEIIEQFNAGIQLVGSEVKSLRNKECSISEAWIKIANGEAWLIGATINPYKYSVEKWSGHEPTRSRKLLLRKREIRNLAVAINQQTLTVIPLEIFFDTRGFVKIAIATAKGKKRADKRQDLRKRDIQRYGY